MQSGEFTELYGQDEINLASVVEMLLRTEIPVQDVADAVVLIAARHSNTTLDPVTRTYVAATSCPMADLQVKLASFRSYVLVLTNSERLQQGYHRESVHSSSVCDSYATR